MLLATPEPDRNRNGNPKDPQQGPWGAAERRGERSARPRGQKGQGGAVAGLAVQAGGHGLLGGGEHGGTGRGGGAKGAGDARAQGLPA